MFKLYLPSTEITKPSKARTTCWTETIVFQYVVFQFIKCKVEMIPLLC